MGNIKPTGEILKYLRKERRTANGQEAWTQEEVAAKINCTVKTYRSWEKDNDLPSTAYLQELANLYQVDCDYLLGRIEQKNHDLSFVCAYTGLDVGAVENLVRIKDGETGGYNIDTAAEIISSPYFCRLIKSIQNTKWALEEVKDRINGASYPDTDSDWEKRSLQDQLRYLKAFRYEVTEEILRVVDHAAAIESVIQEADRVIDKEGRGL